MFNFVNDLLTRARKDFEEECCDFGMAGSSIEAKDSV
jgi:hypothetical protein